MFTNTVAITTYKGRCHLAGEVMWHKNVPGSQVSVYKWLVGQVAHPCSHVLTEPEQPPRQIIPLYQWRTSITKRKERSIWHQYDRENVSRFNGLFNTIGTKMCTSFKADLTYTVFHQNWLLYHTNINNSKIRKSLLCSQLDQMVSQISIAHQLQYYHHLSNYTDIERIIIYYKRFITGIYSLVDQWWPHQLASQRWDV